MSVNTYIYIGYGFIIDETDTDFIENLTSMFPELEGKPFKDICEDFNRYYWESESGYAKYLLKNYKTLQVRAIDKTAYSDNKDKLVVIATASVEELWNKYNERTEKLAFDTDQDKVPEAVSKDFVDFKKELGLEAKNPHPVIWYEYL